MKILPKIKKKISKMKRKLGLENKQSEKKEQTTKDKVLAEIPPLIITDFSVVRHFEQFGGGKCISPANDVLDGLSYQNFRKESKENQLKILHKYILEKSDSGVYKREGGRQIADFFKVSKDVIQDRFNELLERKCIVELKTLNRYYKIKEWS